MESDNNKQIEEQVEEQVENEITTKTVFVSGLPYETTEEELRQFFESCGVIKELKIPKYQDTGRNIGYGHITFKKKKSVKKVKLNIFR